ncbi:MAG: hypothetical protein PsegKO_23520 [Pseudohongiellaceae bacterium]|jgi:hypothetical protein
MSEEQAKQRDYIADINIDQKLIEEGTQQLTSEIAVLEAWLQELDATDGDNAEVVAARKSYNDMLRSRKEMLSSLRQAKRQALSAD